MGDSITLATAGVTIIVVGNLDRAMISALTIFMTL